MMTNRETAKAVLAKYGRTFSEDLGIAIEKNTPAPLFRLLCFSILASARIGHAQAEKAARALVGAGWTTPRKMSDSTWRQRTDVLNRAGYARYDESTSRMLGDTVAILLDEYGGDLRKLRERAGRDRNEERRLLKAFKGIGDVGVDIFFREVQIVWDEVYPSADRRALDAARELGLPADADALTELVPGRRDYTRLVTGLVRLQLDDAFDEIAA